MFQKDFYEIIPLLILFFFNFTFNNNGIPSFCFPLILNPYTYGEKLYLYSTYLLVEKKAQFITSSCLFIVYRISVLPTVHSADRTLHAVDCTSKIKTGSVGVNFFFFFFYSVGLSLRRGTHYQSMN